MITVLLASAQLCLRLKSISQASFHSSTLIDVLMLYASLTALAQEQQLVKGLQKVQHSLHEAEIHLAHHLD